MMNLKKLNTKENILEEVIKLGDFVGMYKNGRLQEILDMKYGVGLNNITSIKEENILYGTKSENTINIILANGDIIEFRKVNKMYMSKDTVIKTLLTHDIKEHMKLDEYYIKGSVTCKEQYISKLQDNIELIINKINNVYKKSLEVELPFIVEENRIFFQEELYDSIWFNDEEHDMFCYADDEQWYVLDIRFGDATTRDCPYTKKV